MADKKDTEMLKRLEDVIEQGWNHVTPGTPEYANVQAFKVKLRAAINPPLPELTRETPAYSKTTNEKQD